MKYLPPLLCTIFLISGFTIFGQQEKVDAGIFPGINADTLIIKARPTYSIPGQSMTNSQLTIKWSASSPIADLQWLASSIGLFPQGAVVISEGYRYQVYGSFGGSNINWQPDQEYPILKLKTNSISGDCTEFEIARDDWTQINNGDYYIEILGTDRTGIRYEPSVNFGSDGGSIEGDTAIYLGNSTGMMNLVGYSGNVLQWERKINQNPWEILPGTAGLASFEDIPTLQGIWSYRVEIEKPGCPTAYSDQFDITVEQLSIWTGAVSTSWEDPGNWNVVGVPDSALDGKIPVVQGGIYPLIENDAFCKNLIIDEDASLEISPEGTLTLSGFLENEGAFYMFSDTSSASSLLDNGIAGSGQFISDLMIHTDQYQLLSSPVKNSLSEAFNGMWAYTWEEPAGQWAPILSLDDTLVTFTGYLVMSTMPDANNIILQGNGLTTGELTVEMTNNGNGEGHLGGFNLIGNPYPSAINWNDNENLILNQIDPALYILDKVTGNYGTYIRNDEGSSTLGTDSIIGSYQGFFVHVDHDASSGSIAVNNYLRLHDHTPVMKYKEKRSIEPYLKLRVTGAEASMKDEIVVRYMEGPTSGFDSQYDAYDLTGVSASPQLFTRCPDTMRLAVNSYPPLVQNTSIPLGFQAGSAGSFLLQVEELYNLGPDTLVLLEDLLLETIHELSPGFGLNFYAAPGDDPDRFLLHFQVEPLSINTVTGDFELGLLISGKSITINTFDENYHGTVEIADLTGRLVLRQRISGSRSTVECDCRIGLYVVRIFGAGDSLSRKVMFGPHR